MTSRFFSGRSVLAAAIGLLAPCLVAVPTGGQAAAGSTFSATAAGTSLYVGVFGFGGPQVRAGFSAAAVNSAGLAAQTDALGATVAAGAGPGRRAEARGRGLDVDGLLVAGAAEAAAPPTGDLVTDEVRLVQAEPLASASLARGEAAPAWSNRTCVAGRPLGYGSGQAADVVLPVAAADVARSDATTELQPAEDGTFTVVAETRQAPAVVQVLPGTPDAVTIELLGETVLRARATGLPGGAGLDYAPAGGDPSSPFLRITRAGEVTELTTQEVFGAEGLAIPLSPLVEARIGVPAGGPGGGSPVVTDDGTAAAGVVDIVRLSIFPNDPGGGSLDLRIGHLEAAVAVPPGGVRCPVPVSKVVDKDPVNPGEEFTFTITVPDTPDALDGLSCDLYGVTAVDVVTAADPGVSFTLLSASGGGVINGGTVTWNLGDYHPGDPPLVVTLTGLMAADSSAGAIADTVRVNAGLTRCQGLPGSRAAPAGGAQVSGQASLVGPVAVRR